MKPSLFISLVLGLAVSVPVARGDDAVKAAPVAVKKTELPPGWSVPSKEGPVELKDASGKTYSGEVIESKADSVVFRSIEGKLMTFHWYQLHESSRAKFSVPVPAEVRAAEEKRIQEARLAHQAQLEAKKLVAAHDAQEKLIFDAKVEARVIAAELAAKKAADEAADLRLRKQEVQALQQIADELEIRRLQGR